ncbi:MAG: DUF5312 family protein [Alkalispirochaeta sp.]
MSERKSQNASSAGTDRDDLGFFERIISLFFGMGDDERQKKRALKTIGKNLSKDRYKFYKPRGREIQAPFARLLYELYKSISMVRQLVQTTEASSTLKMVVIESLMDERQRAIRDSLDQRVIREKTRTGDLKEVADHVKDSMINLVGSFDANKVKRINVLYGNVRAFVEFCHFDYYFTLKKFDSAISEDSFTYKPRFDGIAAEYVVDDIRDFLDVAEHLPQDADWDAVFDVLAAYRNVETVDRDQWRKVWKTLSGVIESQVLRDVVRHAGEDPYWEPRADGGVHRIVEPYLNEIKIDAERTLQKISRERRDSRIEQLVKQVFGTTVVARTKNYTDKANVQFQRIEGGGYAYVEAMNYLKAYLLDYFKKDVREIVQDLLIVRGKWVTNVQAQQVSDAYHGVLSVSEQIINLDESLSEEAELGQKVRRAVGRVVDRDRSSQKFARDVLDKVNAQVLRLVNEAAQNLIIIGKNLKALIEDIDRREYEIITNWKELDAAIETPLRDRMAGMYRQLFHVVQLLQVYVGKSN